MDQIALLAAALAAAVMFSLGLDLTIADFSGVFRHPLGHKASIRYEFSAPCRPHFAARMIGPRSNMLSGSQQIPLLKRRSAKTSTLRFCDQTDGQSTMNLRSKLRSLALSSTALVMLGGCAGGGASVNPTLRAKRPLLMPDVIIINDFAVTLEEIEPDRGLLTSSFPDSKGRPQTAEEIQVGRIVARKLTEFLMEDLRSYGIMVKRVGGDVRQSRTTAVVHGHFLTVPQGGLTTRGLIGFRLGGALLATRIRIFQDGNLVVEADTSTKSSLKTGMLVSHGAGVDGADAAIEAMVLNEAFQDNVDAEVKRTAKEVANAIRQEYVNRGWL